MVPKLRDNRPSHATVVAYLALFVALGGTSVAAVSLKRNSVKGKHIARNAVTGPKVKNASLLALDFAAGQLPKGDKGDEGDPGRPGPTHLVVRSGPGTICSTEGCGAQDTALCLSGERATGGGFTEASPADWSRFSGPSQPQTLPLSWTVRVEDSDVDTDDSAYVTAIVVCAPA